MSELEFEIRGKYFEKGIQRKFTKRINALNESTAIEKAMALIGSNHKVRRKNIMIEETILIKKEEENEQ